MKKINKELLKNICVLYVEDENMIREEVTYFFKKYIPDFHVAVDGADGIEKFNELRPDLIITDIQMPKLNGIEMLKLLDTHIPVLVTTAYSDIEFFLQAIELNVRKFIIKPINLKDLIFDIQEAIIDTKLKDRLYEKDELLNIVDENILMSITDKDGIIIDVSSAFCEFIGYSKEELLGQTHSLLRHEDNSDSFYKHMWDTISNGKVFSSEIKDRKKSGQECWANLTITPVFNDDGDIVNYSAIREDITSIKKLEGIAIEDELTKLYNRRYFNKIIEKEIRRIKRERSILSVACFDIDYFKNYNDSYGHPKGDEVLKKIGQLFKKFTLRASDYAFRMGGEEFCIIFSGISKDGSLTFINKIVKEIESLNIEHKTSKCNNVITISAGLIVCSYKDLDILSKSYVYADEALYEAKNKGRNQVVISNNSSTLL